MSNTTRSTGRAPVRLSLVSLLLVTLLPIILLLAACDAEPPGPGPQPSESLSDAAADDPLTHWKKHLDPNYVCPMHPQIIRNEPGTCPICGMDLVQKIIDARAARRPEVEITAGVAQNLGLRTAPVERGTLWKYIRTLGRIDYDETRLAHVHPRAAGWIETLDVRAEGTPVTAGQTLAGLFAPDILSAQVDFLLAQSPQSAGRRVSQDKSRNLLRLLDVPDDVIREIERSGETRNTVPVRAPIGGVVTAMQVRDGMYVTPATEMFTITELSRVWVLVDVFEHQIDWLAPGLKAEITAPARPGQTWEGTVDYLYPELDPTTRTLKVRLVLDNPDRVLKPNMFVDVVIYGGPKRGVLTLPSEALIQTGKRTSVVKLLETDDHGGQRFQPVDVVVGMQRGGKAEILSGLAVGDRVVVSGQFLIDSESNLRASFARMAGPVAADADADADPGAAASGAGAGYAD